MSWTRLRWVAVILPVLAVGVLDLITDHEWRDLVESPMSTLAVPVIVLVFAIGFGMFTFRRIDRLADDVRERNAALERRNAALEALRIENERLQSELRAVAIHMERERIAREMHDGLAQVLGYVNTKAQAVEELLAMGQPDAARRQLAELAAAARSVYVDVREAILGLTSPVAAERGLVGALEEYAARFSEASKLVTSVRATPAAQALRLQPEMQAQVFRIAQEALTNVRKHAAAQRVRVRLEVEGHSLLLAIEDDGVGFAAGVPSAADGPHFGMQAMRDRAASIHATTEWAAKPGAGTVFRLTLPVAAGMSA